MPNAPWFKFYAADYLSSPFVQSLDPEQELWYLRLIIASAISSPRGCLPLANGRLWRLAKAPSNEYFEQNSSAILAKFDKDEAAGVYRVPKVANQQLLTSSELSRKRSEAGKRGATKKWQSAIPTDGKLPSETMANVEQNMADSDSDSDSEVKPSAADATVADDESEPVSTSSNLKGFGTNRTWEEEGIPAQEPAQIIPTDQAVTFETPDGLNSNQYAARLLEEIRFPQDRAMNRAIVSALDCEVKAGMSKPGVYEYLLVRTQLAIDRGQTINTFFFTDGLYRGTNGIGEPTRSSERSATHPQNTVAAPITCELEERRGTIGNNSFPSDAVSEDSNPDSRHAPIRELVQQMHLKQFQVKCQWDGSEGKALDRLLSANPSWSQEQIAQMVLNRFESERIPPDRPRKWLPNIGSYAAGPQDRFNKLKGVYRNGNGNGNRAERRQAANLNARDAARAAVMAD